MNRQLLMVGVSHRGATLAQLERSSVPRGARGRLLAALRAAGCEEAVVLSTCSRTELYARAESVVMLQRVLAEHSGLSAVDMHAATEAHEGSAVVEHLFRVTAGLESRLVGDEEIHGQVRAAFRAAHAAGATGPLLGQLFPAALRCSDQVRAAAVPGSQGPSMARRAVDLGLELLSGTDAPAVVVVGSGWMARRAVAHLRDLGHLPVVAARDEAGAAALAGAGRVCPLPALADGLTRADLLICATSATHHVVTREHVSQAMADRTRPLVVVDLSVPRNVDGAVAHVPGVRYVDVGSMYDDPTVDPARSAALDAARALVARAARRHVDGHNARRAGPVIAAIRRQVETACLARLTAAAPATTAHEELERTARASVGRLLHGPVLAARVAAAAGDDDALRALCASFSVEPPDLSRLDVTTVRLVDVPAPS